MTVMIDRPAVLDRPTPDLDPSDLRLIPDGHKVRVVTLNALHSTDAATERVSLVCDELQTLGPDVFCLQEVRYNLNGSSAQLDTIASKTGLLVVFALPQHQMSNGFMSGNAILSRLDVIEAGHFPLGTPQALMNYANFAVLATPSGRTLITVSAHLHWGGEKERERLTQMTFIDRKVKELMARYADHEPMAVLAGDFNTLPSSDTVRYLSGNGAGTDGGYTFWTDSFDVLGDETTATTVANDNPWAVKTAKSLGIMFPQLLPNRRIDYVWSYGWTYGKAGSPVRLTRDFTDDSRLGYPASDHYGLTVDFWTPPAG